MELASDRTSILQVVKKVVSIFSVVIGLLLYDGCGRRGIRVGPMKKASNKDGSRRGFALSG